MKENTLIRVQILYLVQTLHVLDGEMLSEMTYTSEDITKMTVQETNACDTEHNNK